MSDAQDRRRPRAAGNGDDERELDELGRLLDDAAADEAAAVAEGEALRGQPVPGLERVEGILAGLWAGDATEAATAPRSGPPAVSASDQSTAGARAAAARRPHGPSPPSGARRTLPWALPLAAAVLVAAILWWWPRDPQVLPPGLPLGGAVVEIVEPAGRLVLPAPVRWRVPPNAEGWTYRVTLRDPRAAPGAPALAVSPRLSGPIWSLSGPADGTAWPTEVVLEVEAFDASNQSAGLDARRLVHEPRDG